jgi:hypothetical protein
VAGRCSRRTGRSEAGYSFIVERSRDSARSARGLSQGAQERAGGDGAEGGGRSAARSPRRIARLCRFGEGKGLNSGGLDARGPSFLASQSAESVPDQFCVPAPTPNSMTCRIVRSVQVRHPALGPFASAAGSTSLLELLGGSTLHRCSQLFHCPPFLTHSISRPFLIRTLQMRVLSPSPTLFKFRVPRVSRSRPQSCGCEGVSGKLGGAPGAAQKRRWARAQGRMKTDDGCSKPPAFPPTNWPENTPDGGAYSRAYLRANWRATSGRPAIDCGSRLSAFKALKERPESQARGYGPSKSCPLLTFCWRIWSGLLASRTLDL